jgi:hypothetical protein
MAPGTIIAGGRGRRDRAGSHSDTLLGCEIMRLYGAIEKVEAQDDGTVRVYGIATSEAVDEQGEIVRAAAIRAAIPDYMCFPALREMHQLSAAGTTLEAEVGDDGTTRIVAHVVDPVAVAKVKNHVYRGFSIGGRVTQRDIGNPKIITGLVLNEISLVDRPANPEAVFDCWKAAALAAASADDVDPPDPEEATPRRVTAVPAREPFNSPIQIWACGVPQHRHLAKAEAGKCLEARKSAPADAPAVTAVATAKQDVAAAAAPEVGNRQKADWSATSDSEVAYADPGYQPDGVKRYPIDTERHIRAAWNYINKPGNARKYTTDQFARVRAAIIAAWKAKIDKNGPPSARDSEKASRAAMTKAQSDVCSVMRIIVELEWLSDMLGPEPAFENCDSPSRLRESIAELRQFLSAWVADEAATLLDDTASDGASRANHSQADQALLDVAHLACDKCLEMGGLSPDEMEHMGRARDHLREAGAAAIPIAGETAAESDSTGCGVADILGVIAAWLGNRGRAPQHMMDLAHDCLQELTDGTICGQPAEIAARHSRDIMLNLEAAHRHLVATGAGCDTAASEPKDKTVPDAGAAIGDGTGAGNLTKVLTGEHGDNPALARVVGEIMPMLERLTKRVDEIARTPLPPLTIAKNTVAVAKQQDRVGSAGGGDADFSPDSIVAALAKMSKEEQTLALLKASYANPIRILRSAADE